MANVKAISTGVWSDPARWDTGALPTSSDDVYANGFTVTINQAFTVLSIRTTSNTGINAGGGFTMSTAYNCTADVYAGTTQCLAYNANNTNWVGNFYGGGAGATHGVHNNGSGILSITGNCTGGVYNGGSGAYNNGGGFNIIGSCIGGQGNGAYGINNIVTGSSPINITGNCIGGTGGNTGTAIGANNASPSSLNIMTITGNCIGGTGGTSGNPGAQNSNACTVIINGNVTGGSITGATGASNSSTGTLTINGNATGGTVSGATGANNASTGTLTITGTAIGGAVSSAAGANNASTGILTCTTATAGSTVNVLAVGVNGANTGGITSVKNIVFGSAGQVPVSGFIKFDNGTDNTATVLKQNGSTVVISDPLNVSNLMPSTTNVRSGIVFNNGNQTGTLIVPSPSNVVKDIATDNTVGTYATTPTLIATEILTKLLSATDFNISGSFGKLIKDNLDATVSSRLATAGYTTPDNTSITAIKAKTDILVNTDLTGIDADLIVINTGVQKASLLIPHTTNL